MGTQTFSGAFVSGPDSCRGRTGPEQGEKNGAQEPDQRQRGRPRGRHHRCPPPRLRAVVRPRRQQPPHPRDARRRAVQARRIVHRREGGGGDQSALGPGPGRGGAACAGAHRGAGADLGPGTRGGGLHQLRRPRGQARLRQRRLVRGRLVHVAEVGGWPGGGAGALPVLEEPAHGARDAAGQGGGGAGAVPALQRREPQRARDVARAGAVASGGRGDAAVGLVEAVADGGHEHPPHTHLHAQPRAAAPGPARRAVATKATATGL